MKQAYLAILLAFLGLPATAQEPAPPLVSIPFLAIGRDHRPIRVTMESLAVTDQKTSVIGASLVRGADLPLELGVLTDTSNSQRDVHLDDLVSASKEFADDVIRGPEDRVFFLKFAATSQVSGWLNKAQLQGTTAAVGIGGGTALYDAVAMAGQQRFGTRDWRKPTRRVLVLMSDGDDNLSHVTRDEAVLEALKAGAVIFAIDTRESGIESRGDKILQSFAKLTGGEFFSGVGRKGIFTRIKESIDGMYYISYAPPDASKTGWHEIEVKPAKKEKAELSYARRYLWNP
jgi:Ca-activated chloride channel family protein